MRYVRVCVFCLKVISHKIILSSFNYSFDHLLICAMEKMPIPHEAYFSSKVHVSYKFV